MMNIFERSADRINKILKICRINHVLAHYLTEVSLKSKKDRAEANVLSELRIINETPH